MKKSLVLLAVVGLVLGIAAGAGATAKALIDGHQLEDSSVTGAKIQDRSLHFTDFTQSGETMIRQGWRLATGKDKVKDTMLDPALLARINAPTVTQSLPDTLAKGKTLRGVIATTGTAAAAGDTRWTGVTFQVPIPSGFATTVLEPAKKSTDCAGTYAAPTATAGHLCVYLGGDSTNLGRYSADAMGNVGFRLAWRADKAGTSSLQATYAFTA